MASQATTRASDVAGSHEKNNSIASNDSQTPLANPESFLRVNDLEGRLRGLILKNNTMATEATNSQDIEANPSLSSPSKSVISSPRRSREAVNGSERGPGPGKSPRARLPLANTEGSAPLSKDSKRDDLGPANKDGAPRGRGRRPNQAQRRQMGKLDLQTVPSASSQDNPRLPKEESGNDSNHPPDPVFQKHPPFPGQQYGSQPQMPLQYHHMPYQHPYQPQYTGPARWSTQNTPFQFRPTEQHVLMQPQYSSNHFYNGFQPAMAYNQLVGDQYARPIAPNKRLYQGDLNPSNHNSRNHSMLQVDISFQNAFVDHISRTIYNEAKASAEELQEKENLRLHLRKICVDAVSSFEKAKNPTFNCETVDLACFGSIRSGFATRGSDMDLALVSPFSNPDPSLSESEIPRLLERVLLDRGYGARLLTKTRVPIIRFCEKPTPELSEKLHRNRTKWEEEKNAPIKQKISPRKDQSKTRKGEADIEHDRDAGTEPSNCSTVQTVASSLTTVAEISADIESMVGNGEPPTPSPANPVKASQISVRSRTDEELVHQYKLAIKEGWFEPSERLIIVKFIEAVKLHGADSDDQNLVNSRLQLEDLPDVLSRYRVPHQNPLDYPKAGVGIQCDINFSNHLALHNTQLLKCYSLCDARVRPMIIVVKAWAKSRKINSSYHGTLSSYGYVLMALHYLMNVVQPPIIPNLQLLPYATAPQNVYGLDGYDVRFWHSEQGIREAASRGQLTQNHVDTIGSLLRGFFRYYAQPYGGGFAWSNEVLSLRTPGGILRKEDKGWTGARTVTVESTIPGEDAKEVRHRYLFAIEDPFELDHNVARTVVHNGIVAIRDEFRRADKIIQSQGKGKPLADGDLFAEAPNKENLQSRLFGPLIKPFGAGVYRMKTDGVMSETSITDPGNNDAYKATKAPAGPLGRADATAVSESLTKPDNVQFVLNMEDQKIESTSASKESQTPLSVTMDAPDGSRGG